MLADNFKSSALVHAPEDSPSKGDVVDQLAAEDLDTVLRAVDHHLSGHRGKDAIFHVGRIKVRIRAIVEGNLLWRLALYRPEKGIGKHLEQLRALLVVMLI